MHLLTGAPMLTAWRDARVRTQNNQGAHISAGPPRAARLSHPLEARPPPDGPKNRTAVR